MKKTKEPHIYQVSYHCKQCGLGGCIEVDPRLAVTHPHINANVMRFWGKTDHDERRGGACASSPKSIILHLAKA